MKKIFKYSIVLFLLLGAVSAFYSQEKNVKDDKSVLHASGTDEMVHQFYAGEAAKIWPGWSGTYHTYEIELADITFFDFNTDFMNKEEVYFKVIVNDRWTLINNNGNYWEADGDIPLSLTSNDFGVFKQSITLNDYEPLVIVVLGCEKDGDIGNNGDNDNNIGKYYLVIKNHNQADIVKQKYVSPIVEGTNNTHIEFTITVKKINGFSAVQTTAQNEINKYIGTRLIYDLKGERFVGTYTGTSININNNDGVNDILYRPKKENIYAFWKTVPYSIFDGQYYYGELTHEWVTVGNNNIIEGTHEEDLYYPIYSPVAEWTKIVGNIAAPRQNKFTSNPIDDAVFYENHFWDSDNFNEGFFNVGGSYGQTEASAYHKAQLYWDYYVIPYYYSQQKDVSYYNLGRLTHLLEDMSSIPHVHRDPHPINDTFENNVAKHYVDGKPGLDLPVIKWGIGTNGLNQNSCLDFNDITKYISGTPYQYGNNFTFRNAKAEWDYKFGASGWPMDMGELQKKWNSMSPLFHLFYSMSETTDNYPSDNYNGDYIDKDGILESDWINKNWETAANDIMPRMISHVAGLYRLFWASTHFPTSIASNNEYSDYLENISPLIATAMKNAYLTSFYNAILPIYIGSPIDSCLVRRYDKNYYRSYNHGGLFYNDSKTEAYAIGEGIWKKYLSLFQNDNTNLLGYALKSEYKDGVNTRADFQYGYIIFDSIKREAIVTIDPNIHKVIADFDVAPISGIAPLKVVFINKSSENATTWEWDFENDGVIDSREKNPIWNYYVPGVYTVKLISSDGFVSTSLLKENLITVTEDVVSTKLSTAEYFFDADPGFGSATKINVAGVSDYLINTKLDVSGLENGIHILGFRVKDAEEKWSHTYNKIFIKESFSNNATSTIVYGEYFYDTDPGIGNGNSISFTQSGDISLFKLFDVKQLSNGIHTLTVRFKDSHGKWSHPYNKIFLKENYLNIDNVAITKLEYYMDSDPGYGLANSVTLSPANIIDKSFTADLTNINNGLHTIFVRAKDNLNSWSHLYSKTFIKESFNPARTLKRIEYFIDNDPGYGNGISMGSFSSEKDSVTLIADLKSIPTGIHIFYCRAMDSENKWSHLFSKMFLTENGSKSKFIVSVEYFFDEDPGYGKGNKVAVNPLGDLEIQFNADPKLLSVGMHKLFIRVMDNTGVWSFATNNEFEKIVDLIAAKIKVLAGWNMVSMPVNLANMNVASVFPNASSKLFSFNNGYVESSMFGKGKGYWLKFDTGFTKDLQGESFLDNKINVETGWNLIGGYQNNIPIAKLKTSSADLIQSHFFGYLNGYTITDTLKAGNAYWIKAKTGGYIDTSSSGNVFNMLAKKINSKEEKLYTIIVTNSIGESKTLQMAELSEENYLNSIPPVPPNGVFDIRWKSQKLVEQLSNSAIDFEINTLNYPVKIISDGANIKIKDKFGGRFVNTVLRKGETLTITNASVNMLEVSSVEIPTTFELMQNYPNPFNPSTVIRYQIPVTSRVTLKVFDILGREVAILVDEIQQPGVYTSSFPPSFAGQALHSSFTSGVYFYQIQTEKFSSVKKMLLIK